MCQASNVTDATAGNRHYSTGFTEGRLFVAGWLLLLLVLLLALLLLL